IILMDVQMPVMDGYEATRHLRANPQNAALPIVALSAGVFKDQITAAREAGMDGFIAKPFNVDELIATVRELTLSETASSNAVVPTASGKRQSDDYPGVALEQGLALWGEVLDYRKYLLMFSSDYRDAVNRLTEYLDADDQPALKALAHKIKGAAGNLALIDIAAAAGVLEKAERHEQRQRLNEIGAAFDTAFTSISHFAKDHKIPAGDPSKRKADAADVLPLLSALRTALDADTPDNALKI